MSRGLLEPLTSWLRIIGSFEYKRRSRGRRLRSTSPLVRGESLHLAHANTSEKMGSVSKHPPRPWIETPCVYSAPLSRVAGWSV